MTLQEFYDTYKGRQNVGNTPANKGQCVGLSSLWMDNFNIPHVYGHAKDLYTNAPDEHFEKIPNTPDAIVQDGDIVCWSAGYNGTFGHTGVAYGKHDVNNFDCFEQNDPLGSTPHIKRYNYAYVIGWLRPKAYNPSQPSTDYEKLFNEKRKECDLNYNLFRKVFNSTGITPTEDKVKDSDSAVEAINALRNDLKAKDDQLTECENKPPKIVEKEIKVSAENEPIPVLLGFIISKILKKIS